MMAKFPWYFKDVKEEWTDKGIDITFRVHRLYLIWVFVKTVTAFLLLKYTWLNRVWDYSLDYE